VAILGAVGLLALVGAALLQARAASVRQRARGRGDPSKTAAECQEPDRVL